MVGEAAVLVALSPLATVDMMLMLWRNLRMIEDIADVYAIEPRLLEPHPPHSPGVSQHALCGATELVTEVGMDLLGAELTAKLSARAAQGVGAGLLTARPGCVPWKPVVRSPGADEKPNWASCASG